MEPIISRGVLDVLAANSRDADERSDWPTASWDALAQAGILRWGIGPDFGGAGLAPAALLAAYEQLASACLTTCFILSQRDSAVRRIENSDKDDLRRELLGPLARGARFATVGLSQLTTSRQHQRPALLARQDSAGFRLDGAIPWVTGAAHADHLVLGAVTDAGTQILAALPTDIPGLEVAAPLDLMALQGSMTAEVRLDSVMLERRWLLAGPAERVLTSGRSGPGGLETSCLALGLAGAAIEFMAQESAHRPELCDIADNLDRERGTLRAELHRLAGGAALADQAVALRTDANSLVLRATQAALTVGKGTGFLRNHPAQRWARQALFFLVWSCPRPTADATLARLAPPTDCTL